MSTTPSPRKSVLPQVMLALGITMFIVYISAGIAVMMYGHLFLAQIQPTLRLVLGALVILYALFRLYRVVNLYKKREAYQS